MEYMKRPTSKCVERIKRNQKTKSEYIKLLNGLKGVKFRYINTERNKIKITTSDSLNKSVIEEISDLYDLKNIKDNQNGSCLIVEFKWFN